MGLSNDLISTFVRITNDNKKVSKESTVYGTAKYVGEKLYVKLDGSNPDVLTPVYTTVDVKDGERVAVLIKNHTAAITGNTSSPAARTETVKEVDQKVTNVENQLGEKLSVKDLEADLARIQKLETETANITVSLTAAQADIKTLSTDKLDAETADIKYATVEKLNATNATLNNLIAQHGEFEELTALNFEAVNGKISSLQSDVADIDTLIFGSASGETIQTSFANAVIAQLGNAQIKSAMIDNISANKITSGDIITNDVRVLSEDGKLLISDETIQIKDDTRVRVQIGKDASNDYSINIWDAAGNLMFSKGGITDSAIKEAIIRNDMVSDTANIHASKLDIDSLFEEINGSANTIKSTKVYLDDQKQTLDVAFEAITTDTTELQNKVSTQGTQISTIQGQISSKIWQQDINTAKTELQEETETLSTQYSTLDQKLNGVSSTVASHTTEIAKKADNTTVTEVSDKVTTLEQNLEGFQTTVSDTYATKKDVKNIEIGGRNLLRNTTNESRSATFSGWQYYLSDAFPFITDHCNKLTGDQKITLSGYIENLSGTEDVGLMIHLDTPDTSTGYRQIVSTEKIAPGEKGWVKITGRVTHDVPITTVTDVRVALRHYSGTSGESKVNYHSIKLELGDKATDWTAAPEDLEEDVNGLTNRISSAESSITQLSNKITSNVTETTNLGTRMSTVEQTASGLTARVSSTEDDIAAVEEVANAAKKQLYHSASGTAGTTGYVGFCTITVTGNYVNRPILFELNNRGRQSSNVSFCFSNQNNTDPTLAHLQYDGGIDVWAYKADTSKWILIAQKSEGYDTIYVKDFADNNYSTAVEWSNIHYDALPTSNITAGTLLAAKITKATVDNAAKTATNYLNFSSSGLVVGDMTANTLGKNVLIDSDSVDIRNGSTTLASFGANKVTLGQNAEDSSIDLCDGAGTISTRTSEASTSWPKRNAILVDSQEIETESVRFVATVSNEYDASSTPAITREAELYMLRSGGSSESCARLKAIHTTNSSGAYTSSGISAMTYDAGSTTRALVFANDSANSAYNQLNVYPTKTTMNKPLVLNGTEFTGKNKVLWSGGLYMTAGHTATLSEAVSAQANGIVLIFSRYSSGEAQNHHFQPFFVPKNQVSAHKGCGHTFLLSTDGYFGLFAAKYLYINDTNIAGNAVNNATGTGDCGIKYTNNGFVLRYVIGV